MVKVKSGAKLNIYIVCVKLYSFYVLKCLSLFKYKSLKHYKK